MIVYAARHMFLCMCICTWLTVDHCTCMCVFLGTAAPLPNSVGITAVKLINGDVEVYCSIPVTNCLVLVHSINSPEQLYVRLINSTDERRTVFSVDLIGIMPQPL